MEVVIWKTIHFALDYYEVIADEAFDVKLRANNLQLLIKIPLCSQSDYFHAHLIVGQWVKLMVMSVKSHSCAMCSENNEWSLKKWISANWIVYILFNTTVTGWLREQSPLTEDELQKLCISMDDFKVLNNLL